MNNMRTEQDVLKDFEKLGYGIEIDKVYKIIKLSNNMIFIRIFKNAKSYEKYFEDDTNALHYSGLITSLEHKLLNELFQLWRWI